MRSGIHPLVNIVFGIFMREKSCTFHFTRIKFVIEVSLRIVYSPNQKLINSTLTPLQILLGGNYT